MIAAARTDVQRVLQIATGIVLLVAIVLAAFLPPTQDGEEQG